jgi:hypothetical protein
VAIWHRPPDHHAVRHAGDHLGRADAATLNAELRKTTEQRQQSIPALNIPISAAGNRAGTWIAGGAAAIAFGDRRNTANRMTTDRQGSPVPRRGAPACGPCQQSGHGNEFHSIPAAWSGVYYVDDGVSPSSVAGRRAEFMDPRPGPAMYAPHLASPCQAACRSAPTRRCAQVRPAGGVPGLAGIGAALSRTAERISIAFNLSL